MTQLWLIERDISGWTDEDLEAAGIRARFCAPWYASMVWVRSFHDREGARTLCVYQAESEADIRKHSAMAGLPCGTVTPVAEVLPDSLGEGTGRTTKVRLGSSG